MNFRISFPFLLVVAAGGIAEGQQVEAAKLFPPREYQAYATFVGARVAIAGKWAVVGDSGALGGGRTQFFRRDSGGWSFSQAVRGPVGSRFGGALSVDQTTVAIGAPNWDWKNTRRGKAYTYSLQNGQWQRTQEFLPKKLNNKSDFGTSVAVSGDVLVVGAPGQNLLVPRGGEVFIYERTSGVWRLVDRMRLPPVAKTFSLDYRRLGSSVAVDGNVIVAGAPGLTGAAFVYERGPSGWARRAVLEDPTPQIGDIFGGSVDVSGDTIIVGEPVTGTTQYRPGSAFIFEKDAAGTWNLDKEIRPTDGFTTSISGDHFGMAVSVDGDRVFVGMPHGRITGFDTGTGYLFERGPNGWPITETERLIAAKPWGISDLMGQSVALSGGFMVAGAIGAYIGPNRTGAAYVFEVELGQAYCPNVPNSTGQPGQLTATGSSRIAAQDLTLSVRQCPANRFGAFAMSSTRANQPLADGLMCLGAPRHRLLPAVFTGPGGHAIYDLDFGDPVIAGSLTAGSTWCFQFWYLDPAGGTSGSNFSNAIALTLR